MVHVPPVEYGTLYRFVASLGLLAVVASVAVPWLFISNTGILMITQEQLELLTQSARNVIELRQEGIALAQAGLVAFALFLFLAGISALWWSVTRWASRQHAEDKKYDIELLKAQGEFEAVDDADVAAKSTEEALALASESLADHVAIPVPTQDPPESSATLYSSGQAVSQARESYSDAENRLLNLLREAYEPAFHITGNVRSKSSPQGYVLDFLVDPRTEGDSGPIGIELKLVSRTANPANRIREAMLVLAEATEKFAVRRVYTGTTGESPLARTAGVVIVILAMQGGASERIRARIRELVPSVNAALSRPIGVMAVSARQFDTLTADNLRGMIALALQGEVATAL